MGGEDPKCCAHRSYSFSRHACQSSLCSSVSLMCTELSLPAPQLGCCPFRVLWNDLKSLALPKQCFQKLSGSIAHAWLFAFICGICHDNRTQLAHKGSGVGFMVYCGGTSRGWHPGILMVVTILEIYREAIVGLHMSFTCRVNYLCKLLLSEGESRR